MKVQALLGALAIIYFATGCSPNASEQDQVDFIVSNTSVETKDLNTILAAEYEGFWNGDFYSVICVETNGLSDTQLLSWSSNPKIDLIEADAYLVSAFSKCFPDMQSRDELIWFVRSVEYLGSSVDSLDLYAYDLSNKRLFNGAFQN